MNRFRCKPLAFILLFALICAALYDLWDKNVYTKNITTEGESIMPKDFYTGGNVLDFFSIPDRNAMKVTWAHKVNGRAELDVAIKDSSILMLEADVRLRESTPVMAHGAADTFTSNLTLEEWLVIVSSASTKGIKLDFKSTKVLEPAFTILRKMEHSLHVPVWINADILRGPNSISIPVDATQFLDGINASFRHSTLSTGWTTYYSLTRENQGYSQDMVEEMYRLCKDSRQAITFPVRAALTAQSIDELKWLIDKSDRFSLTVWHSGPEPLATEDLIKIHASFEQDRVYYDLPVDTMASFQNALIIKIGQ